MSEAALVFGPPPLDRRAGERNVGEGEAGVDGHVGDLEARRRKLRRTFGALGGAGERLRLDRRMLRR